MARFTRLTRADLDTNTRDDLLDRIEAEQEYWKRKQQRGLSPADEQARREFSDLIAIVLDPSALADSMAEDAAWLRGERGPSAYWSQIPGGHPESP